MNSKNNLSQNHFQNALEISHKKLSVYKKKKKTGKEDNFRKAISDQNKCFSFLITISLQRAVKQLSNIVKHAGQLVNEKTEPHLDISCYLFDEIRGSSQSQAENMTPASLQQY